MGVDTCKGVSTFPEVVTSGTTGPPERPVMEGTGTSNIGEGLTTLEAGQQ